MDETKNGSCFLCGQIQHRKELLHIHKESEELKQKIKETLPNIVLHNDNNKYMCIACQEKLSEYQKFMQEVTEHQKHLGTASNLANYVEHTQNDYLEKVEDFCRSYNHSDTVYKCPNCDVDLMILLVSNSQENEYSFNISLAMVDHNGKIDVEDKKEFDKTEIIVDHNEFNDSFDTSIDKESLNIVNDDVNILEDKDDLSPIKLQHDIDINNGSIEIVDEYGKENSIVKIHKNLKRKADNEIFEEMLPEINMTPKLQIMSYQSDSDTYNYESKSTVIEIKTEAEILELQNNESDYRGDEDFSSNNFVDINTEQSKDNDAHRPGPRIVCELCGMRYISQLKYEFHMERHKLDEMDKFVCPLCGKSASNENLLWDHYYYTHKSSQRYMCLTCNKLFLKKSRLNNHQKWQKHIGSKVIDIENADSDTQLDDNVQKAVIAKMQGLVSVNCNLCGKLITDLDPEGINDLVTCSECDDSTLSLMVDGNEAKVISPRQYHCSKCPKHFVRKERLEFHEMRHNENMKEFICSTCGKEFRAENSLYEHYIFVHKGARPHICELCGKSFQLKARLKEHHRTHTGERPFQCDICGQRCMTNNALRLHRKIHFSHNRYSCNICNKTFSKKQNMNEHLEKHWKSDKNVVLPHVFTCPVCSEDFPTYRMLKYHVMEVHNISDQDPLLVNQKPWYECAICQQKFKHQMSLKAHRERVHEGKVNPIYHCDTCNATFKIKQLLINHIKSKHDGEKRYMCAQCEKGFNDTKSLYNHVLLHTGKKPFVCEYCGMAFRRKDSRDHHHRKHTGEQPYQCQDCSETFATYNSRAKHRKQEHEDSKTVCPECGEKCNGEQEVRMHLNKHLGEKLKQLKSEHSPDV